MHGDLVDSDTRIGGSQGVAQACRSDISTEASGTCLGPFECTRLQRRMNANTDSEGGEANDDHPQHGLEHEHKPVPSPRSRRVGIVSTPQNYKRPHSLLDLKDAAAAVAPSGRFCRNPSHANGTIPFSPPLVPPRSPLRPTSLRPPDLQDTPTPSPGHTPTNQRNSFHTALNTVRFLHDSNQMNRRHSLGSLSALLVSLAADPASFHDKELPLPPGFEEDLLRLTTSDDTGEEDDLDHDNDDSSSSSESLAHQLGVPITPGVPPDPESASSNQPAIMTKRMHALVELLSSERAYASDLALIRDIHIPLALGKSSLCQPLPFSPNGSSSPPLFPPGSGSGSSSRTVSTVSDSSTSSSQLGPPMTRADARLIFGNIEELAVFADRFVGLLEKAMGDSIDSGTSDDRVGSLFLEIIPSLEPPYKTYITRHPTALAHLNALPSSPALSAYLSHTRTLASSLTHAWDLPSLLIKPVQRLLKYSLLLGAIIDATPDAHTDRAALIEAKQRMEEVARSVNEERRRWEVVREVLGNTPLPNTNGKSKKGSHAVGVGVTGTVHRMKSLRPSKLKEIAETALDNAEATEVARLESELQRYAAFFDKLARDVKDWRDSMHVSLVALRQWGITFGAVLGLTPSPSSLNPDLIPDSPSGQAIDTSDPAVRSEAYDAFTLLLSSLPPLCDVFDERLNEAFIPILCELKLNLDPPKKLLNAMHTLSPLHTALLHVAPSKGRRPAQALLTASQSYLALRSALAAELPLLLSHLNRATGLVVRILAEEQASLYFLIEERWAELWDALRVEGERCSGAEETLRVWWERWSEVEGVTWFKIIRRDKWWAERERELKEGCDFKGEAREKPRDTVREKPGRKGTAAPVSGSSTAGLSILDSPPLPAQASSYPQSRRHHVHSSTASSDIPSPGRRRSGSSAVTPPLPVQVHRRPSDESLRSGKSGKSSYGGKSGRNSRAEDEPPVPRLKPNFIANYSSNGPQHRKSAPTVITPLRTSASLSSTTIIDIDATLPPSPFLQSVFGDDDQDRGRSQRQSSVKAKITDSFRPAHHRRRSSSVKSLGAPPSHPSYATDIPLPYSPSSSQFAHSQVPHPSSTSRPRASPSLATTRALYTTRVIHACDPPRGVSYRKLPFFTLEHNDTFDVLREYGHPSTHVDLPLYVDDGEDCLLLVRTRGKGSGCGEGGEVGWALASFLVPVD
ncbi:hypothetical protein V8B97DRAFT_1872814 [Scleroderma yunnanense]